MTDVAKLANAISRPRIDPRKFVDLGIVTAVDVTEKGIHVDVITVDGVPETAAVSPPYGGPGYGLHLPVDLDQTVLLAVPDGVFNAGARVVGAVWDEGDPPPDDVIDNPDDVVLVVKPGQNVRIIVQGGGDIVLEARGGGKIRHGGDDADDPIVRRSDLDAFITGDYNTHIHQVPGVTAGPSAATSLVATTPAVTPGCSQLSTTK
jgi:hypothetical protein